VRGARAAFALVLGACGQTPAPHASPPAAPSGPVTGTVNGEAFRATSADGLDCDYCGGRHDVRAKLHDTGGATVDIDVPPDLDVDDVDLAAPPADTRPRAYVVWQHDGSLRAIAGRLHLDAHAIPYGRMHGCLDARFDQGGHVAGCFDVKLDHSAGAE
jgi:hypothetical protein